MLSVLQSSSSELGEECGAKDIAGLQTCWEGAESSSPNLCCTVAELLAPSLAGLCPDSHRNPLLRLFTGTCACLNLCGCPASSCGIEDVVPITTKAFLTIRAIYIYSFCYLCALLCPGEFCSSLPVFKHKYPQWGLQIHTSLENWHVILRVAMQHPNCTSHKA